MQSVDDLRTLVRRYLNMNFSGIPKEDREDIEQETMIRLWRRREHLRAENQHQLKSYVIQTTKRLLLDRKRTISRRPSTFNYTGGGDDVAFEDLETESPSDVETKVLIEQFFDSLTDKERSFWLMSAKGMSFTQMEEETGCTRNTWARLSKNLYKRWASWQIEAYEKS